MQLIITTKYNEVTICKRDIGKHDFRSVLLHSMLSNANHLGYDSYQSHIGCLTKGQVRLKFEHIDGLPVLSHLRQPFSLSHSLLN